MPTIRLSTALIAPLVSLLFVSAASADTQFGADPNQQVNTALGCASGAPTGFPEFQPFFVGTEGSQSCMWTWSNPAVGSDIVPFPATGGSGTITSVTLPAMPNPGPMALVILTAALNSTGDPAHPQSICCQVKQVGPTFTVPANQVATVSQGLHVSATEEADLSKNGDTSFGDLVGVAILSPSASLPVRYTQQTSGTNFDGAYVYYPAPSGPNGEYQTPLDPAGFQMLARFTLALAEPPGEPAAGGLKLGGKTLRVGADGKTVTLGTAANPPTAGTTQTLTAPGGAARASALGSKAKKPVVYGSGKTTVAAGKTVPVKVKLNGKARAALKKKHRLKATLTVIAANAKGETQTVTRQVTIKPKKKKRR
jgi:hypothetical protein